MTTLCKCGHDRGEHYSKKNKENKGTLYSCKSYFGDYNEIKCKCKSFTPKDEERGIVLVCDRQHENCFVRHAQLFGDDIDCDCHDKKHQIESREDTTGSKAPKPLKPVVVELPDTNLLPSLSDEIRDVWIDTRKNAVDMIEVKDLKQTLKQVMKRIQIEKDKYVLHYPALWRVADDIKEILKQSFGKELMG